MTGLDPTATIDALMGDPQLTAFMRDRQLAAMPAKLSRRLLLLDAVAQAFEPGIRYPEPAVNDCLRHIHADHATLRRYLVDEGFLDRADGVYWRIGGSTAP
jgi:hypothetical protein